MIDDDAPRGPMSGSAGPDFDRFLAERADLVRSAGLSPAVLRSRDHFESFLRHGYLDFEDDPDDLTSDELSPDAYAALKELTYAYFRSGAPFFVPIALKKSDYLEIAEAFVGIDAPGGPGQS